MVHPRASLLSNLWKLKYCIIQTIKNKRNSEWVTSSTLSFAYHWVVHITVLWKISVVLKCHNFLILHPILMKFSAFFLFDYSLMIQINFFLGWTCPLSIVSIFLACTVINRSIESLLLIIAIINKHSKREGLAQMMIQTWNYEV